MRLLILSRYDALGASSRLGYLQGHAAVVWPRHDIFFTARDGRRAAALLDTQVVWADRARTFVPVDRPDLVAAAVQRILRTTATEQATVA